MRSASALRRRWPGPCGCKPDLTAEKFAAINAIYARYFPNNPPARIFVCVPQWFAAFDIEIDCIAAV
jgi:enamine deaminase RidA (YjgF/YER057c/UK114 family)